MSQKIMLSIGKKNQGEGKGSGRKVEVGHVFPVQAGRRKGREK